MSHEWQIHSKIAVGWYSSHTTIMTASPTVPEPAMLDTVASLLKSVNPSLRDGPPSLDNGDEVCYLGPNGEQDILCRDLPFDMLGSIGSW